MGNREVRAYLGFNLPVLPGGSVSVQGLVVVVVGQYMALAYWCRGGGCVPKLGEYIGELGRPFSSWIPVFCFAIL